MQTLFARLFTFMLLALPIYLCLRILYSKKANVNPKFPREFALCLFTIFMAGLLALVFQPGEMNNLNSAQPITVYERIRTQTGINLVPFKTISGFFKEGFGTRFTINIFANILMFAPVGFFLPFLWERWRKPYKVLIAGFLLSVTIEVTQLFIARSVDVDDVILNTLGIMLGYWIYWLLKIARAKNIK